MTYQLDYFRFFYLRKISTLLLAQHVDSPILTSELPSRNEVLTFAGQTSNFISMASETRTGSQLGSVAAMFAVEVAVAPHPPMQNAETPQFHNAPGE